MAEGRHLSEPEKAHATSEFVIVMAMHYLSLENVEGRQAGRQAGGRAGRQAGRQTGRQAGRQADQI